MQLGRAKRVSCQVMVKKMAKPPIQATERPAKASNETRDLLLFDEFDLRLRLDAKGFALFVFVCHC